MKMLDFLRAPGAKRNVSKVLETKFGTINLAKDDDREKVRKLVVELMQSTDALTRKDIGDWRVAWQTAINVDNPNRTRLYNIYRDVEADLHLSGCVAQRKGFVMARSFKLSKPDGSPDEEAVKMLNTEWFKQLMGYCLDAVYWGFSLVELGDVVTDEGGMMAFDGVTLIPRKHVIPEKGRVVHFENEAWTSGVDYHQQPFSDWLIEAGRKDDLGLYLKAAQQTIPKKNTFGFWDTFGEMFGIPFRVAKTTSRDEKDLSEIEKMMNSMGAAGWGVFPDGTEIEVKENAKGDAYNVFDKRIERANSELSKLIILQTMTIEDGSSLSQSKTHLQILQNLIEKDADNFRDIVNGQLLPLMVKHGFPVKGLTFDWDYSIDYTPEQQIAYETMVADRFEVDPKYFEDKYGMPARKKQDNSETASPKPGKPDAATNSAPSGSMPFFD